MLFVLVQFDQSQHDQSWFRLRLTFNNRVGGHLMTSITQILSRHRVVIAAVIFALAFANVRPALAQTSRPPAIVTVCAPCHGVDGTTGDVEKPNLAGQKSIYLRQQLLAFRSGKRKHPDMKTISRDLTDREIDQLVVYYSTLIAP